MESREQIYKKLYSEYKEFTIRTTRCSEDEASRVANLYAVKFTNMVFNKQVT